MSSPSRRPVVVIGPTRDAHVIAIVERVRAAEVPVVVLDPAGFPRCWRLTLGEQLDDVRVEGRALVPACVYVRHIYQPPDPFADGRATLDRTEFRRLLAVTRDRIDVLTSLVCRWERVGVPVYNGATNGHRVTKPYQLALLREAGLPVPATLWSNDPTEARQFTAEQRVAYKAVAGGSRTREVMEADLSDERLATLRAAPVTFQRLLTGADVRVYVLDGEVIAAIRIATRDVDYRQREDALDAIELPAGLAAQCRRAAEVIGLRFTGMDLKHDDDDEPRFLELNSSPMFVGFDALAGTRIADRLASALVSHARAL
jgi:glutathione synthase/RimK-type ligase-like ATP-grasp enzyme